MNFSIGTDIEDISRFRLLDLKKDRLFLNKIFTRKELDYCFSKKNTAQHLAARFAAKEAVIKAINSLRKTNLQYYNIEIINNEAGMPIINLKQSEYKNLKATISLSHCRDKAIAFVLILEC